MSTKKKTIISIEAAQKKVSPKAYSKYLASLELSDIRLQEVRAKLFTNQLGDEKKSYSLKEDPTVESLTENGALVTIAYKLSAKSGRKKVANVAVKVLVGFSISKPIPPEFFVLYNQFTLPLQTYPYFRECVHSLFSKMGLPPLILPLRKYLLPDSE